MLVLFGPLDAEAAMTRASAKPRPQRRRRSAWADRAVRAPAICGAAAPRSRVADSREAPPELGAASMRSARRSPRDGRVRRRRCSRRPTIASVPGVPHDEPFVQPRRARRRARGRRRAVRARRATRRCSAITGTNGKTTVTALTGRWPSAPASRRASPATSASRCSTCSIADRSPTFRARAVELPARDHAVAASSKPRRCST